MKKMIFAFVLTFALIGFSNATENLESPPCISGDTTIMLGQSYQYTSNAVGQCADCYDWDISGVASIGSDTGSSVTVTPNSVGTFTLDLTYFTEEGCKTCSINVTVIPDDCSDCVDVDLTTDSSGNCISARGNIDNCLDGTIASVDWSWALAGICGQTYCSLGTSSGSPFTSLDVDLTQYNLPDPAPFPGYYIVFSATINYLDGTSCEDSGNLLLTCWNTSPSLGKNILEEQIKLYPNPSKVGSSINFEGIGFNRISTILVYNIQGDEMVRTQPKEQAFSVDELETGIYFVHFKTIEGKTIQKKLIIE